MAIVVMPLTGTTGDAIANVATDLISTANYQYVKLIDAAAGSTVAPRALATTPAGTDAAMVTRPIGSTAFNQAIVGAVGLTSGASAVGLTSGSSEVALTSVGSTKLVGQVTVANPTTAVTVSSGVILAAGSSGNIIGSVTLSAGTSANTVGSVALVAGTTANSLGSVALLAGSSANIIGAAAQGPGSSANFHFMQSIPFSSANLARTTVNTTIDISIIAANANRKALVIASLSTAQTVALGLTTGAVTTALGNACLFLSPTGQLSFGLQGGLPLFTGPIRGINITSTAVAGGVAVMEFT